MIYFAFSSLSNRDSGYLLQAAIRTLKCVQEPSQLPFALEYQDTRKEGKYDLLQLLSCFFTQLSFHTAYSHRLT